MVRVLCLQPDAIAAFTASEQASAITGTVIKLNCGSRVD
jgi:hypothetical protein